MEYAEKVLKFDKQKIEESFEKLYKKIIISQYIYVTEE